jgi:hypothetical protein
MKDEWKQLEVTHCPIDDCKGMLLQNSFRHYEKCTDCGRCFFREEVFTEVEEKETHEYKTMGAVKNDVA